MNNKLDRKALARLGFIVYPTFMILFFMQTFRGKRGTGGYAFRFIIGGNKGTKTMRMCIYEQNKVIIDAGIGSPSDAQLDGTRSWYAVLF
jgi:hypothetical protein